MCGTFLWSAVVVGTVGPPAVPCPPPPFVAGGFWSALLVKRCTVPVATALALLSFLFSAMNGINQSMKSSGELHDLYSMWALFLNVVVRPDSISVGLDLVCTHLMSAWNNRCRCGRGAVPWRRLHMSKMSPTFVKKAVSPDFVMSKAQLSVSVLICAIAVSKLWSQYIASFRNISKSPFSILRQQYGS